MGFARTFLTWGYNVLIDSINAFIKALCTFIVSLASLLPASITPPNAGAAPGGAVSSMMIQVLNWLFPMQYLLTVVGFVTAGMLAYFASAVVLRWFKVLT
jgi:hypothetical protein